jgi:hypothetical protein
MLRSQEDTDQLQGAEEQKVSEQHIVDVTQRNQNKPQHTIFGNNTIFNFIESGNVAELMKIFETNRDVLFYRSYKDSMNVAIKNGHDDVVIFLNSIGADKSFNHYTIDIAAKYGRLDLIEYLCDNRNDGFTYNAITWAAQCGYMDIVTLLNSKRTPKT